MSAPRKIWAYSMDAEEDTHGGWDVRQDDAYAALQSLYHHDDVVRELARALRGMVYETTHLSPMEADGSHWCKISEDALTAARAALAKIAQEDQR